MQIAHDGAADRLRELPTRLVGQAAILADRASDRAFAGTGSRRHHFALLATLAQFGPLSQAELGRRTHIDRSDIVAAVNDLVARDLVLRDPDPADRRRNIVTLTDAGARHLAVLDDRLAAAQDELLLGLSATERRQFVRLLTRVLDAHAGCPPA